MTKIVFLILVAGFALCGSTTGSVDDPVSKTANPIDGNADAAKKATQTVRTFMELIAAGENEKAKALMFNSTTDRKNPDRTEATGSVHEVPPTLDWVTVLSERKFRLNKIVSEHSDGDMAEVETELNTDDMKSSIQKTIFELRKVGDDWRISDVDLVDKYAPKVAKSPGI
jgi:hypothetical protein